MKKWTKILTISAAMLTLTACGAKGAQNEIDKAPVLGEKEEQLVFEEEYISKKFSYAEGGKFAMSMISGIGSIAAGVAFESPTSIVSGIFSILTTINDNFCGSQGPNLVDVMNKLGEMDTKLDYLNEKLDKNYNQLSTEVIRTQAMVDQVLLEEQEKAISDFNTNYVEKIDDYNRNFSDYVEQSYKSYVNKNEVANIYIAKNEDNAWYLVPEEEQGGAGQTNIQFDITDFTNSKTFLEKNYNVISNGFMDRFDEDIANAMNSVHIPSDLDIATAKNFVTGRVVEDFTRRYYKENHDKALELRNLAINYAKQINGKSTKSIVDRYISRMRYMFNFAGEMKEYVIGSLANLAHTLDVTTAAAAQACLYAEVNQDEIRSQHIEARDLIKTYYDNLKEYPDSYCFLTNTKVGGGFYKARFNTSYSNKGNHPTFSAAFAFTKINAHGYDIDEISDNVNSHSYLNELDHTRIATRLNLMIQNGVASANTYAQYLVSANVLPKDAYTSYETLLQRGWISNDAYRFFTGLNVRDLNDGDRSLYMTCMDKGNPGGDYFNVGWNGYFRGGHDASCWNGKIAETTYIDGTSGTIMSEKKVAAYATYSESHCYWIDDEYWSFVDNPSGNYFFILENIGQ